MAVTAERDVNGVRLYYEEQGSGAPILCIHGAGGSAALWRDALRTLARLGRAITYDRRGYGRSGRPEPRERMHAAEHAADAAALLGALRATPAVVIARSYGGEVATELALRHPDAVRALVLLEAAPAELVPAAADWTRRLRDHLRAVAAEAGEHALGEALIGAALGEAAWSSLPDEARAVFTHNGLPALADLEGEWAQAEPAALAAIQQPVLLVTATASPPRFREPNAVMAAALRNARTARVGGGHLIDPAAPAVLAFVDEIVHGRYQPSTNGPTARSRGS